MKEIFIVCINYGTDGHTLDVYKNEEEAIERTREAFGSSFRVFKGIELDMAFKPTEVEEKKEGK